MVDEDHSIGASTGASLSSVEEVPLDALTGSYTPRLGKEDEQHCRLLAEVGDDLPPVIVHRRSMRVIDGLHRVVAARHRGSKTIDARFFDGDEQQAFVLAVRANVAHGKPLTLRERRLAATKIIQSTPEWSDRAIAEVCGLSPGTVANLRRATVQNEQSHTRVGRDGRQRPRDSHRARAEAAAMIRENPTLSLRDVARATGLSPNTVRDVRDRLRRGQPPETDRAPRLQDLDLDTRPVPSTALHGTQRHAAQELYRHVRDDGALQATVGGRDLSRWLDERMISSDDWRPLVDAVPKSRIYVVAELAQACARTWSDFAAALEERAKRPR